MDEAFTPKVGFCATRTVSDMWLVRHAYCTTSTKAVKASMRQAVRPARLSPLHALACSTCFESFERCGRSRLRILLEVTTVRLCAASTTCALTNHARSVYRAAPLRLGTDGLGRRGGTLALRSLARRLVAVTVVVVLAKLALQHVESQQRELEARMDALFAELQDSR